MSRTIQVIKKLLAVFIALIVGIAIGVGGTTAVIILWNKATVHPVVVTEDIDLAQDHFFTRSQNFSPKIQGTIKKGSIGTQTFKKGNAVYVNFPIVIEDKYVERLDN